MRFYRNKLLYKYGSIETSCNKISTHKGRAFSNHNLDFTDKPTKLASGIEIFLFWELIALSKYGKHQSLIWRYLLLFFGRGDSSMGNRLSPELKTTIAVVGSSINSQITKVNIYISLFIPFFGKLNKRSLAILHSFRPFCFITDKRLMFIAKYYNKLLILNRLFTLLKRNLLEISYFINSSVFCSVSPSLVYILSVADSLVQKRFGGDCHA